MSAMMESSETSSAEDDGAEPSLLRKKPDTNRKPKSRFKGVFRCGKKFKSQIQTNGVQHYLGLFDTEEDAARAYDSHARTVLGPKAKTNFELELLESEENGKDGFRNGSSVAEKQKGTHPRRTYVGIKARRKRPCEYQQQLISDNGISHTPYNDAVSSMILENISAMQNSISHFLPNKKTRTKLNDHDDNENDLGSQVPQLVGTAIDVLEPKSWHEQLFYWFGELSYDLGNSCLLWKGSWLPSIHGKPELDEFTWNNNVFEYIGPRVDKAIVLHGNYLLPVSGQYSGFYTVDMNEVIGKYFDKSFEIQFDKTNDDSNKMNFSVIGNGMNDFGRFVISGNYNAMTRRLEIVRQYLSESDERTSMSFGGNLIQRKLARILPFSETFATSVNTNLQHQQPQHQQLQPQVLHDIGIAQISQSPNALTSSASFHVPASPTTSTLPQSVGSGGGSSSSSHSMNYSVSVASLYRGAMMPGNGGSSSSSSSNGSLMMPPMMPMIGQHSPSGAQLNPAVAAVLPLGAGGVGTLDCDSTVSRNPCDIIPMNHIAINNTFPDRNSSSSLNVVVSEPTTTSMTTTALMSPHDRTNT